MHEAQDILLHKLDEFTRKYYKNQLLKGSLYATGLLLSALLTVSLLEYFGEFGTGIRAVLFFTFLASALTITGYYIVVPLLKLYKIGQLISHDQAAEIIGKHFSNVADKLLNVLQLQNRKGIAGSEELWLAGINQKVNELRPLPFAAAIDFNENKKYLRYVLPIVSATALIAIVWPHVLTKSTSRIVNYNTYYEREMPFKLIISNPNLSAAQAEDFKLLVAVEGKEAPAELSLLINGLTYKMEKEEAHQFFYTFPKIQSNTTFQFFTGDYTSKPFTIEVLPKAALMRFGIKLHYPAYLQKPDEVVQNNGDVEVPQGTTLNWMFTTRHTESLTLSFVDDTVTLTESIDNGFVFSKKFMASSIYGIHTKNHFLPRGGDSVQYKINVIADKYPFIEMEMKQDSLNTRELYFSGQIRDDYGFSSLTFHYTRYFTDSSGQSQETHGNIPLGVNKQAISQSFYHLFNVAEFNPGPGEKFEYYFEVTDNDGVNGHKSARTPIMVHKTPTQDEIQQATDQTNAEIEKSIEESIKKSKQIQKEITDLLKRIAEKKQVGYEEKKKLEDLLKQQKELEQKINQAQQQNENNMKRQQEFSEPMSEQILEKQQQLEKLFESVLTPEMKRLFDEMNKLLEQMDKNKVQEKLEELKLTNKDIEKELDRNLEAFKQLEVQQKMEQVIEKLDELKQKQEELKEKTTGKKEENQNNKEKSEKGDQKDAEKQKELDKNESKSNESKQESGKDKNEKLSKEELAKQQEALQKEFEKLQEEIKEMREKNASLEEPMKMPDTKQKEQEISNSLEKSKNEIQKGHNQKAGESQKDASDKMGEMQESMEEAMEEEASEQEGENAETLRQVIENLLHLSFEQEKLMATAGEIRPDNPRYTDIPRKQLKLRDDSKMIEDSLLALAKRAPQISATVNRAISAIHSNMDKTIRSLTDRNVGESRMRMQQTMSAVNELAVMLDESLEQMQQQMQQKKNSKGEKGSKCKKPGKNSGQNPSSQGNPVTNMRKLQEQLNKQLQEMKEAMEKGQKPGQKPGDKSGSGMGMKQGQGQQNMLSSEQFARMAAQQEALRRQMQELMSKLKKEGKGPGGDVTNLMEETEKDLVNKQLTNETIRRQQQILTRLLESEKAAQEREQDEQRKSNEAKFQNLSNPERFLEYKRMKEKEMELLNTVPPSLTPYYKDKVTNYFNNLQK